jgi:hypothetical protein
VPIIKSAGVLHFGSELRHAAFTAITLLSLTTKHRGFSEEVEWRVIYFPERDRSGLLKEFMGYHIGDRGIEPKLKCPVESCAGVTDQTDLTLENIVDRIILGPSESSLFAKQSASVCWEKSGSLNHQEALHVRHRVCESMLLDARIDEVDLLIGREPEYRLEPLRPE